MVTWLKAERESRIREKRGFVGKHLLPSLPSSFCLCSVRLISFIVCLCAFSVVILPPPVEILLSPAYTSFCLIFRPYLPSFSLPSSPPATDSRFQAYRRESEVESNNKKKKACSQPLISPSTPAWAYSLPHAFLFFSYPKWKNLWPLNMDD